MTISCGISNPLLDALDAFDYEFPSDPDECPPPVTPQHEFHINLFKKFMPVVKCRDELEKRSGQPDLDPENGANPDGNISIEERYKYDMEMFHCFLLDHTKMPTRISDILLAHNKKIPITRYKEIPLEHGDLKKDFEHMIPEYKKFGAEKVTVPEGCDQRNQRVFRVVGPDFLSNRDKHGREKRKAEAKALAASCTFACSSDDEDYDALSCMLAYTPIDEEDNVIGPALTIYEQELLGSEGYGITRVPYVYFIGQVFPIDVSDKRDALCVLVENCAKYAVFQHNKQEAISQLEFVNLKHATYFFPLDYLFYITFGVKDSSGKEYIYQAMVFYKMSVGKPYTMTLVEFRKKPDGEQAN
ncbi:hypothetical protein Tsubulata_049415 [Turnera subulata]|uniref:Cystatin domain-containing protein n=1 Tax=Turnera subulata TaxID=218843 RepID=A0A9Q0FVG4_9ROSI|nr:hypothetical protein Tsubulata_049415 [Turnera subulata]